MKLALSFILTWSAGEGRGFLASLRPLHARITVLWRWRWISASSWFQSLSCAGPFMSRPSNWICCTLEDKRVSADFTWLTDILCRKQNKCRWFGGNVTLNIMTVDKCWKRFALRKKLRPSVALFQPIKSKKKSINKSYTWPLKVECTTKQNHIWLCDMTTLCKWKHTNYCKHCF